MDSLVFKVHLDSKERGVPQDLLETPVMKAKQERKDTQVRREVVVTKDLLDLKEKLDPKDQLDQLVPWDVVDQMDLKGQSETMAKMVHKEVLEHEAHKV